jgi:hypothetical protein
MSSASGVGACNLNEYGGVQMPEYRICYVTPDGHIAAAPVRFVRENDRDAVKHAQRLPDRNS